VVNSNDADISIRVLVEKVDMLDCFGLLIIDTESVCLCVAQSWFS